MPSITLHNVEFTLDTEQILDAFASAAADDLNELLGRLVENHPMGLITRLAQFEGNRREMAAQLSGFGVTVEDEDEQADKAAEAIRNALDANGFAQFVDDFDLQDDAVEWALDYREDEVIDALKAAGTIPDVDLDEVKYDVREAARLLDSVADSLGA